MEVQVMYEHRRWCGYRSPAKGGAGLYLIGPGNFEQCERLPFPFETCPCCGIGVKPARGFTWINPSTLFDPWTGQPQCCEVMGTIIEGLDHDHNKCYMCNPIVVAGEQAGIIWVGEKFYKTAHDFMLEARAMGISRKIGAIPDDFEIGKHVIYLAHRKVALRINDLGHEEWVQGVFSAFRPIRLDIVIDDPDDVPEKAVNLAKRLGDKARIIKVIPITETEEGETDGEDW